MNHNQKPDASSELAAKEIPIYAANKIGVYYPQDLEQVYELTDHLSNVRAVVKEMDETITATMEENVAAIEEILFDNVDATRQPDENYAYEGVSSARLNGAENRVIGPATTIAVQKGSTVTMEVYGKYDFLDNTANPGIVSGSILASALGAAFGNPIVAEGLSLTDAFMNADGLGLFAGGGSSGTPGAYLNYLLFNENYEPIDFGYMWLDEAYQGIASAHQLLQMTVNVPENGYIYIYTSQEATTDDNVFFDNLKVNYNDAVEVTRYADYYPFGSVLREAGSAYRFGYQGEFAEKDEETGWSAFTYRTWVPEIARWASPDPARQFWSLYIGMDNNPINQIDPDGTFSRAGAWWRNIVHGGEGIYQSGDEWGFNIKDGTSFIVNGESVEGFTSKFGTYGEDDPTPRLTVWDPNMFEKWSLAENFIASTTYDIVDGPWVTAQFFVPWRKATHLNGQVVIGVDGADAWANTFSNVLPYSKLSKIPKLTAPQFSHIFKGNLAKLSPKNRGRLQNFYNKYFVDKAHGTMIIGVEGASLINELNKE